jgi:hypothetical protein
MRKIKIALVVLTFTLLYVVLCYIIFRPIRAAERLPEWTPAEKKWVVSRMKYHNISSCERTAAGSYRFKRRGVWNKL